MEDSKNGQARVVRVGIGRLYNLGNYEHVRYDLTIEIPEDADALGSVTRLRKLVRALKPITVPTSVNVARSRLNMTPEARAQAIKSERMTETDLIDAQRIVDEFEAKKNRQKDALQLFNDLGGESVHTDHKDSWDDDDWDY